MSILITGASGYVGSNLVKRLRDEYDLIAVMNNHTIALDNMKSIRCDLRDKAQIEKIFKYDIESVIHLAGQVFNKDASPDDYMQSNLDVTRNVLDACIKRGVKSLVFSSSMAVYGINAGWFEPLYLPIDENHPIRPYEYYGLSKYLAEILCKFYSERYGMNIAILRYSRIYGPSSKGFITYSIKRALDNREIVINSNISTDFVYIDDVINATINAISLRGLNIFNIGSGEEIRLLDLANMIIDMLKSASSVRVIDSMGSRFYYNIASARIRLHYDPLSIREGIRRCINHLSI